MTARKSAARKKSAPRATKDPNDAARQRERETTPNHPDNTTKVRVEPVDGNTVRATA